MSAENIHFSKIERYGSLSETALAKRALNRPANLVKFLSTNILLCLAMCGIFTTWMVYVLPSVARSGKRGH